DSSVCWQYVTDTVLDRYVPFALYRHVFDTRVTERMFIAVYDDGWGDDTGTGLNVWDTTGVDSRFNKSAYEPIYGYVSLDGPYDPANEAGYIAANNICDPPSNTGLGDDGNPVDYPIVTATIFVDYRGRGLPIGNKVKFITNKLNLELDTFTFSTADYAPSKNATVAKDRLDDIQIFPNPYFAYQGLESSYYSRFVTFNNLPETCIIRIFSLSGQLVRCIEHMNATPFERWDLMNEVGRPVASGMYIIHIETEFGNRIIKLGVVQREIIYRHF
ncbi:T9SS type A sorting domain-containing protein, partial [bacterium]|nr:T9SS type A sorting domain-containing protein [bacterium]